MNKKYHLLLKDTAIFAAGSFGSKIILFFLVPLYTNYLSTGEYGIAELVFTYSQFIIPIASLMIYDAILRFGMSKDERIEDVAKASVSVFLLSIVITLLMGNILATLGHIGRWRMYIQIYVLASCLSQNGLNYLKTKNKNRAYSIVCLLQTICLAGLNIILVAYFHMGVRGYLLSNTIAIAFSAAISLGLSGFASDVVKGRFDASLTKRMLKYSIPLIFNNISWWVINSSDKVMIEAMLNTQELGLYTVASKIPSLINVIISVFTQAWGLSSIREVEEQTDTGFMSSVFEIYSFITFGAAVILISIMKPFMAIYVGPNFRPAWVFTPLLLAGAVFYALASYYASLYSALKRTLNSMWTTVVCAVLNVFINYIGIKLVGTWGAIIGTVCSFVVITLLRAIDVQRYLKLEINWMRIGINSLILFAQAITVSLNWHVYVVSVVAIVLFCLNNGIVLKKLLSRAKKS